MWTALTLIVAAYVLGAIPSAYLMARFKYGIDIRQFGSGNVGASNLIPHTGRIVAILLGMFDCFGKGMLLILLARILGQEPWVQAAMGLTVVFAHNWSPYIRFTGGRGAAATIGVLFGYLMIPELAILTVFMLLGSPVLKFRGLVGRVIFNEAGFWTFIALLSFPALAFVFNRPTEIIYACIGISLLLLGKRLTANWESPQSKYPLHVVFFCRIMLDRDVPRKDDWVERKPRSSESPI